MPFDLKAAREAGYSDEEIASYLNQKYNQPAGARPGPPEEVGLQDPGLLDPVNYLGGFVPTPGALLGGVAGRIGANRMATAAIPRTLEAGANLVLPAASRLAPEAAPQTEGMGSVIARAIASRLGRKAMGPLGDVADVAEEVARRRVAGAAGSRVAASEAAPAVIEQAAPALKGLDALKAMKPLRANASAASRHAQRIELETAMDEAKLGAQARKALRQQFGFESAGGKIAGEIKPAPPGSAASRVAPSAPGKVAGEIKPAPKGEPPRGSVESRANVGPKPASQRPPGDRRELQYYSESKGQHLDMETMHPAHLRAAINKDQRELAKFGENAAQRAPRKYKELQELLKELDYRMRTMPEHTAY